MQKRLEYLEVLQTLPDYAPSQPRGKELLDALVEILNEIIPQQDFYSEELFAGTPLQDDTERFVAEYFNNLLRPETKR